MESELDVNISEPIGSYNPERDFTSLDAWKRGNELKFFVYRQVVPLLPPDESFNLISQIKRAGVSVTANIAEGYGRFYFQDSLKFYRISRGSAYEMKDHLMTCHELGFIDRSVFLQGMQLIEAFKMTLNGYIRYIRQQATEN